MHLHHILAFLAYYLLQLAFQISLVVVVVVAIVKCFVCHSSSLVWCFGIIIIVVCIELGQYDREKLTWFTQVHTIQLDYLGSRSNLGRYLKIADHSRKYSN